MKARHFFVLLIGIVYPCLVFSFANAQDHSSLGFNENGFLPTSGFIENKGQFVDFNQKSVTNVLLKLEVPGVDFYITEQGATYVFKRLRKIKPKESEYFLSPRLLEEKTPETQKMVDWARVDLLLSGAVIKKEHIQLELPASESVHNYYYGHSSTGVVNLKSYHKVTITEIYPGIDWVFYNLSDGGYKYDFIVHSNANINDIELIYRSKEKLNISSEGGIEIITDYGQLVEAPPQSFFNGTDVESQFILKSIKANQFGGYDSHIKFGFDNKVAENLAKSEGNVLIIDPQLVWSTFYGGDGLDGFTGIKTDLQNNVYVVGYTSSINFPTQSGGNFFQGTISGNIDGIILKFDNNGTLIWATHYGGDDNDQCASIDIDGMNNIFVTGFTNSTNFPVQNSGTFYQGFKSGFRDAFILKFDSNGNRIWATYYGGGGDDETYHILVDNNNDIVLTGGTVGTSSFPTQNSGGFFQGSMNGFSDAFILKFDNNGNRLWATYYGGGWTDAGQALAIDAMNNLVVVGKTRSNDFPTLDIGAYYQGSASGNNDIFIIKFDNNENLVWGTLYGGNDDDEAYSVEIDNNNNIFVAGESKSLNFPTQNNGTFFQNLNAGLSDAFILKFDNTGNRQWATLFGGSSREAFSSNHNLSIDRCNNLYLAFESESVDMPTFAFCNGGYFKPNLSGGVWDQFITKFTNDGALLGATYFGGDGVDVRSSLTIDLMNNLWLAGEWVYPVSNTSYPLISSNSSSYIDTSFNGNDDSFIAKFENVTDSSIILSTVNSTCSCDGAVTASISGLCPPYNYYWSNGVQVLGSLDTFSTVNGLCYGLYEVMVVGTCDTLIASVNIEAPIVIDSSSLYYCDSAFVNNEWYYTSQVLKDTLVNAQPNGCDTISIKNLIIYQSVEDIVSLNFCDSVFINNQWLYESKILIDTFANGSHHGCDSIVYTNIAIVPSPILELLPLFDTVNFGESLSLKATGAENYYWQFTGQQTAELIVFPVQSTLYCVIGSNKMSCSDTTCAMIYVEHEEGRVYVPNTFTPNGDSTNDIFKVRGQNIEELTLTIYNRWGEILFISHDMNVGWDGTYNNQNCANGMYIWTIIVTTFDGNSKYYTGHVNLLK